MGIDGDALTALLPLIVLGGGAIVVMLAAAFGRRPGTASLLTLASLALAFIAVIHAGAGVPRQITGLLMADRYTLFYWALIIAAGFAVAALCHDGFVIAGGRDGALHALLLLATLGGATLAAASHFASFFLGLELLSVSLFALIAYPVDGRRALEAGVKYLVLSGGSSAFLLFGLALIYLQFGTLEFGRMGEALANAPFGVLLSTGLALIVVGVGFKLAVVPFHMWIADVYEGTSPPVAAFVSTVSKGAVITLLMRFFLDSGSYRSAAIGVALSAIAVVSILVGNLLALLQDNIKRILGYSSVAHLGYLLVAFSPAAPLAAPAVGFYLTAYFVTMITAFGVVGLLSGPGAAPPFGTLADCRGLLWRRPLAAGVLAMAMLSLAGLPMTMGFIAKFYIIVAGAGSARWVPVFALVVGSTIGLFYYLRIIAAMAETDAPQEAAAALPVPLATGGTLAALAILLVWLGVYPAPLTRLLAATVAHLL